MNEPFKFRFVTQITGFFVLVCLGLLVASIFVAGKKQKWFEPKYVISAVARGEEGAHGLRPGSIVQLSSTPIGKVTSVELIEINHTRVEITIQERYKSFIDSNSRLLVRKMYQLAGNASVEIIPGDTSGSPLSETDVLAITSDQALMETAREFLEEAKRIGLPIIEKFDHLLENLNDLTASINNGKGPMGNLLHNEGWSAEVSGVLTNLNHASTQISPLLAQADAFSKKAVVVAENLESISANAGKITDDFTHVSDALKKESQNLDGLLVQIQQTLLEIERLTKGVQKHWLVRKYIDDDPDVGPMLSPLGMRILKVQLNDGDDLLMHVPGAARPISIADASANYEKAIRLAEAADDDRQLGVNLYNYGACLYSAGENKKALDALGRSALELQQGTSYARTLLMKALVLHDAGEHSSAREVIKSAQYALKGKREQSLESLAHLLLAESWLADGDEKRARDGVKSLKHRAEDSEDSTFLLMYYQIAAELEPSLSRKAEIFDKIVAAVRDSENYMLLPAALSQAGGAWLDAKESARALDRYYRSARSAWSQGNVDLAQRSMKSAQEAAKGLDGPQVDQVKDLAEQMGNMSTISRP